MENLKDAAHGLNDVRKTLSNEVEQRRSQRIRAADLKNQANVGIHPAHRTPSGMVEGMADGGQKTRNPTTTTSNQQQPPPVPEEERLKKRKVLSSMPASFSPESSGQMEEGSGGMFKRLRGKKGGAAGARARGRGRGRVYLSGGWVWWRRDVYDEADMYGTKLETLEESWLRDRSF